jgi:hypothetical protein
MARDRIRPYSRPTATATHVCAPPLRHVITKAAPMDCTLASLGVAVETGLRLTVDYFFYLGLTVDSHFELSTNCRLPF